MGLLSGKKAFIFGVANERSIAWGIAKALHAEGAELGFNFLGEALEKRVRPLAESVNAKMILPCDVSKDNEIEALYKEVEKTWGKFDILVHCIAFANKDDLTGAFSNTSRAGFHLALDVSAFSLLAITRPAVPLLNEGASIIALTYYGSEKVIPNYNVMGVAKAALEASVRYLAYDLGPKGIRVNAISAGPLKTLAASAVGGIKSMLKAAEDMNPLKRNITQDEVGSTATYLASSWASGVTGEVLFVDAGANIVGMHFDEKKAEGSAS
ncbi:MAG TPA: enoyl-ACP reductase [bacterium]|nr:enoyl-ACP reductase [bacterium]